MPEIMVLLLLQIDIAAQFAMWKYKVLSCTAYNLHLVCLLLLAESLVVLHYRV